MLSRPSFSIRRLMPQRKSGCLDGDQPHETEDSNRKNRTWPRRSSKGPITPIDIRRSQDIHRIIVLPPLPDTPRSWTSSVYSDDEARFTRPRSSPTPPCNRTPHGSPPRQIDDTRRPRSSSLAPPTPPSSTASSSPSPRTLTLREDLSPVSPLDAANTPLSARVSVEEVPLKKFELENRPPSPGYASEMEQLLSDMEEVFQLWRSATEGLPSPPPSASGISDDATQGTGSVSSVSRASLDRRTSQRSTRSTASSTKTAKKAPLKISTPIGQTSASRTKKARLRRSFRQRPRGPASWSGSRTPSSRWTLTGSAKDLFSIRLFNRIEADEMLPESVLHEIRMSRATQARLAREAAAVRRDSDSDSSLTEPDVVVFNQPVMIPQLAEDSTEAQDIEVYGKQLTRTQLEHIESPIDSAMIYNFEQGAPPIMMVVDEQPTNRPTNNLPLPPVPRKNHHRRSPMKQTALLPTIPEVIAVGAEPSFLSPTSRRKGTTDRVNTDEYVYLGSAPYSYCCPGFRHGPIRLAKADLPYIGKLAAAVDDTLDWTAFQMAILGGAGDFFGESTDYSKPSESELAERDDVARWFAEFGFDGLGGLVSAADAAEAIERQNTPCTPPDSPVRTPPAPSFARTSHPPAAVELETKEQLPPPPRYSTVVRPSHPPQHFLSTGIGIGQEGVVAYHNRNRPRSGFGFGLGGPGTGRGLPLQIAAGPVRRESTESVQSLPQSPMLDLVVSRDVDGNEYVVPMGFNLGHDLGDFLKWEAENVFGGGFYEPDTV